MINRNKNMWILLIKKSTGLPACNIASKFRSVARRGRASAVPCCFDSGHDSQSSKQSPRILRHRSIRSSMCLPSGKRENVYIQLYTSAHSFGGLGLAERKILKPILNNEGMNWIYLAQDSDQWRSHGDIITNLGFHGGHFWLVEWLHASQKGLCSVESLK
jgi:hypothetical protein